MVVNRGDVCTAIETPSGEIRPPHLRRPVADAATACEEWFTGLMPEFKPLGTDLFDPKVDPESVLDTFHLASMVVDEVSYIWRPCPDRIQAGHLARLRGSGGALSGCHCSGSSTRTAV